MCCKVGRRFPGIVLFPVILPVHPVTECRGFGNWAGLWSSMWSTTYSPERPVFLIREAWEVDVACGYGEMTKRSSEIVTMLNWRWMNTVFSMTDTAWNGPSATGDKMCFPWSLGVAISI